jgi:hypothetical protein
LILEFFENSSRKFKFNQNLTKITGTLHDDQYPLSIISCSVSLRMRNVSDRIWRENQRTLLCLIIFPRKSFHLRDSVKKYGSARQVTDGNIIQCMCITCWITQATDKHSEYVVHGKTGYAKATHCYVTCLSSFCLNVIICRLRVLICT